MHMRQNTGHDIEEELGDPERVIRAERNGEGASESKIASSLNDVGWYDKATSMGLTRNTLGDGSRVNMPAQWLLFSQMCLAQLHGFVWMLCKWSRVLSSCYCFLIKSMDSGARFSWGSVLYLSPCVRKNNGLAKMPTSKFLEPISILALRTKGD